jgi:uncharacterized protein (TIGR00251 family)
MEEIFKITESNKAEIYLKVRAGAKNTEIKSFEKLDNKIYLKIYVSTAPEDGKANEAIIALISKKLKIKKSDLLIAKGEKSPVKLLEIKNIHLYSLKEIFSPYIV